MTSKRASESWKTSRQLDVEEKSRDSRKDSQGHWEREGQANAPRDAKRQRKMGAELEAGMAIKAWLDKIEQCPVFKPSKEEFKDPAAYIASLEAEVAPRFGICKIIPPVDLGERKGLILPDRLDVRQQALKAARPGELLPYKPCHRKWTRKEFKSFADRFADARGTDCPEKEFWVEALERRDKSVRYALDVPGGRCTGPLSASPWSPKVLPMCASFLFQHLKKQLPGVSEPMLYIGMLYSQFAWHTEDHDAFSLSYLHEGAEKVWYGSPASAALTLERAVAVYLGIPLNDEGHKQVLRRLLDKATMVPPNVLMEAGVPMCRAIQRPGEFVITFPRAYHAGLNQGLNYAEAVNFAPASWLPYGAVCGRRYQRLRQKQVLPFERILCLEAEAVYTRLGGPNGDTTCQPASCDLQTMATFVRLIRAKYQRLQELRRLQGLAIKFIATSADETAICNLCNDIAHVATLQCLCEEETHTCLDHENDIYSCGCTTGQAILVTKDFPRLVQIARSFEKCPDLEGKMCADLEAERSRPELMNLWANEEGGRQTESGSERGAGTERGGIGTGIFERWAPIPGFPTDTELTSDTQSLSPLSVDEDHQLHGEQRGCNNDTRACKAGGSGANGKPGGPSNISEERAAFFSSKAPDALSPPEALPAPAASGEEEDRSDMEHMQRKLGAEYQAALLRLQEQHGADVSARARGHERERDLAEQRRAEEEGSSAEERLTLAARLEAAEREVRSVGVKWEERVRALQEERQRSEQRAQALQARVSELEGMISSQSADLENAERQSHVLPTLVDDSHAALQAKEDAARGLQKRLDELEGANEAALAAVECGKAEAQASLRQQLLGEYEAQAGEMLDAMQTTKKNAAFETDASHRKLTDQAEAQGKEVAKLEVLMARGWEKADELGRECGELKAERDKERDDAQLARSALAARDAEVELLRGEVESVQREVGGMREERKVYEREAKLQAEKAAALRVELAARTAEIARLTEMLESAHAQIDAQSSGAGVGGRAPDTGNGGLGAEGVVLVRKLAGENEGLRRRLAAAEAAVPNPVLNPSPDLILNLGTPLATNPVWDPRDLAQTRETDRRLQISRLTRPLSRGDKVVEEANAKVREAGERADAKVLAAEERAAAKVLAIEARADALEGRLRVEASRGDLFERAYRDHLSIQVKSDMGAKEARAKADDLAKEVAELKKRLGMDARMCARVPAPVTGEPPGYGCMRVARVASSQGCTGRLQTVGQAGEAHPRAVTPNPPGYGTEGSLTCGHTRGGEHQGGILEGEERIRKSMLKGQGEGASQGGVMVGPRSKGLMDTSPGVSRAHERGDAVPEGMVMYRGVCIPAGRAVSPVRASGAAPHAVTRARRGTEIGFNCANCSVFSGGDVPTRNHRCPFKGPQHVFPPVIVHPRM